MRALLASSILALTIGWLPAPARASTVFVPPEALPAGPLVHGVGVPDTGDASFTFLAPDDLQNISRVTVITVGNAVGAINNRPLTYSLHLSISQNLQRQDALSNDFWNLPATATSNTTVEIDVSSIFPSIVHAGLDVVTMAFDSNPNGLLRIVGLRFEYQSTFAQSGVEGATGSTGATGA